MFICHILNVGKLDEDLESFGEEAVVNRKTTNSNSLTKPLEKQWNNNPLQKHNGDDSTLSMRLRDNKDTLDSELLLLNDGIGGVSSSFENGLSEKQKELIKYSQVKCKKDFTFLERVNGRPMNVLKGLELHTGVFNIAEQNKIIEYIYRLQWIGKQGKLKGTFPFLTSFFICLLLRLELMFKYFFAFSLCHNWKLTDSKSMWSIFHNLTTHYCYHFISHLTFCSQIA